MTYFSVLLKSLKNNIFQNTTISVIGPSGAGKTTLLQFLETGKEQIETPPTTIGLMFRKEPYYFDNWNFNVIDVGGQDLYRYSTWELAIEQSKIVIYMIDATNRPNGDTADNFEQDIKRFEFVIKLMQDDQFILILLNKQDLSHNNPIKIEEFRNLYPIDLLKPVQHEIYLTSAKYGTGIDFCFKWIIDKLNED